MIPYSTHMHVNVCNFHIRAPLGVYMLFPGTFLDMFLNTFPDTFPNTFPKTFPNTFPSTFPDTFPDMVPYIWDHIYGTMYMVPYRMLIWVTLTSLKTFKAEELLCMLISRNQSWIHLTTA